MNRPILIMLALLATAPVLAQADKGGFWQDVGAGFRSLGHGLAEAGRDLGHGLRDLGNATADGIREGADATVDAGRELGDELSQAVDERDD